MGGHPLKEKFLADAGFKKLYEQQYRALYTKLLAGDAASGLLDMLVAAYNLNDGADAARIAGEAGTLRTCLETRKKTLGADQAITGA
ncbi:hypothetical protein Nocox_32920 [Nonomuraea coxensis DSM 45129]|uniref:Uncharacterized protein n=1 Tax=Nonomuraea coxensis DSM 45129 TaxID=1122611 RepID=A0ABX8UBD8_9ACTN|nr:hypothetical protein [Nonomuraea coxensis]QYC44154.1 hypothetical protein Nocox_32920 [Nonomuraea coxensis DSM 45129]